MIVALHLLFNFIIFSNLTFFYLFFSFFNALLFILLSFPANCILIDYLCLGFISLLSFPILFFFLTLLKSEKKKYVFAIICMEMFYYWSVQILCGLVNNSLSPGKMLCFLCYVSRFWPNYFMSE